MELLERMWRQKQRDLGNPYKEGTAQWRAWGNGYEAAEFQGALKLGNEMREQFAAGGKHNEEKS